MFPKLCEAVRELHEAFDPPLIHRDLKPSNVMLTRDNLTLIDFGIARSFDEAAEQDTHHFGTRAYAPPEQFGYGQSDARTDVYALGMLLYFCLTEKTPDAKARRAGYRDAGVPEPLRAVVERAAAFDPRDRYASVRSSSRRLGRRRAARPLPAATERRGTRWRRRGRLRGDRQRPRARRRARRRRRRGSNPRALRRRAAGGRARGSGAALGGSAGLS